MKKLFVLPLLALLCTYSFAQEVTLTFTGKDADNLYCQLDSVCITNLTQHWQTVLYWPDTTLIMQNGTGVAEHNTGVTFGLSQNNPNPFNGTTDVNLTVTEPGTVTLEITDVNGRTVETHGCASLQPATHQFRIHIAHSGVYILTARQNGRMSSVKMVNNGDGTENRIEYVGLGTTAQHFPKIGILGHTSLPFQFGDMMEYVGFSTIHGEAVESDRITQAQGSSQTFILQFPVNQVINPVGGQPCPGISTVTDIDGNTYHTVLIGSQCWMKENLKTTHYANGAGIAIGDDTSSTIPFWYYPNNSPVNKELYGLLYNWPAVMHGQAASNGSPSGVRGICPNGWHVPSDAEWLQMEISLGMVASVPEAFNFGYRGHIAAKLCGNTGWAYSSEPNAAGNTIDPERNSSGFSALPAGHRLYNTYGEFSIGANFWTSTANENGRAIYRSFHYDLDGISRAYSYRHLCNSVRCIYDGDGQTQVFGEPCPGNPTLTDVDGNVYNTVQIGQQCWMKENLRTTRYSDGAIIQNGPHSQYDVAHWYYPNNDSTNLETYGLLYNWTATMRAHHSSGANPSGVQGVCPTGWHIPSVSELVQMRMAVMKFRDVDEFDDVFSVAASISGDEGWTFSSINSAAGNTSAFDRNVFGFSALPAGSFSGSAFGFGYHANIWSSTYFEGDGYAYQLFLSYANSSAEIFDGSTYDSYSVRCVRDDQSMRPIFDLPCPGMPTVTDVDGNTYNTILIGEQCWTKENLRTTKYADGTPIAHGNDTSTTVGYWYYVNNDPVLKPTHGLLYNWKAVMRDSVPTDNYPTGFQSVCPTGWHVPSEEEWRDLNYYITENPEYRCSGHTECMAKCIASADGWGANDEECYIGYEASGNNTTGFNALPAGIFPGHMNNYGLGDVTNFWACTEFDSIYADVIFLTIDAYDIDISGYVKYGGGSVRCLQN